MVEMRSHPAIFAGLMGGTFLGVPTCAYAVPLDNMVGTSTGPIVLQLALGCAVGAALAGGIAFIAERIYVRNNSDDIVDGPEREVEHDEDERGAAVEDVRQSLSLDHADNGSDVVRAHREDQALAEAIEPGVEAAEADEEDSRSRSRHMRRARHMDWDATIRITKGDIDSIRLRSARHLLPAEQMQEITDVAMATLAEEGRHGRDLAQPADRGASVTHDVPAQEPHEGQPMAQKPESHPVDAPATTSEDASDASAKEQSLFERVSAGAKSVRKALAARLAAASTMDDVPLIKRADGSASEVVPSRFGPVITPVLESIVNSLDEPSDTDEFIIPASESVATPEPALETSQSAYISRHVSEVEVGLFPERRSIDEVGRGDMWEEALVAMGDTLGEEKPQPKRVARRYAAIGESDRTAILSDSERVRSPEARADGGDTDIYVDYLLRDELSRSGIEVLRSSPHAHLRVIEGGTGVVSTHQRSDQAGADVKKGRHYASENLVREA